jgi:hypothetical protein
LFEFINSINNRLENLGSDSSSESLRNMLELERDVMQLQQRSYEYDYANIFSDNPDINSALQLVFIDENIVIKNILRNSAVNFY